MRIRTQFYVTLLLFGVVLAGISASVIITGQQVEVTSEQERIAGSIAQGASELNYLVNDYVIYQESQQLQRWQTRFDSFSKEVARLEAANLEQEALVGNIRANTQRIKNVFDSIASAVVSPSREPGGGLPLTWRLSGYRGVVWQSRARRWFPTRPAYRCC